jgi:hypothetical protein
MQAELTVFLAWFLKTIGVVAPSMETSTEEEPHIERPAVIRCIPHDKLLSTASLEPPPFKPRIS